MPVEGTRKWSAIAGSYDRLIHFLTFGLDSLWIGGVLSEARLRKRSARVLDVATGTGNIANELARHYPTYEVLGIDYNESMLKQAIAKGKGLKNVRYMCINAENTGFEENSFDVITCAFALGNFESPQKAIGEMRRLLAPGGKLILLQMNKYRSRITKQFFDLYYTANVIPAFDTRIRRSVEEYVGSHPIEFDRRSVERLLEDAGFKDIRVKNLTFNLAFTVTARK